MHTYREKNGKFEVGYYAPDYKFYSEERAVPCDTWETVSVHKSEHDAILRVNLLNGGSSITGI